MNIFDGDLSIAKSDVAVSDSLRNALCDGIKPLEDVPERLKDWHPRSNNLVLDLVHPSLFPVAYGLTRYLNEKVPLDKCLEYIGRGTTMDPFTPPRTSYERPSEWGSFQWLPTDVKPTDKGAKLQGYINNLHPKKHADLYEVLEAIVGATIPMWEETLSGFYDRRRIIIKSSGEADWHYTALFRLPHKEDGPDAWYDPNADVYCAEDGTPYEGEEDPDEYEDWQWEDPYDTWKEENRILKQREPKAYTPQAELAAGKKKVDLGGEKYPEGLQVIFKLANIHLTPEKPEYGGGSWHVEGGLNEGICASAIYYFDQDNITESRLAFRQAVDAEEMTMVPEQNLHEAYERHMGVEQHGPPIQELGKALTREGRLLAFPNCVQHRVEPFSLEDRSRPGYRKILAMFLIDPERRVLSTSNVPPQRRDWWAEELRRKGVLGELPAEIREHTIDMVDFPISWEKAVEMREKLMDERSFGDQVVSEKMMEVSSDGLGMVVTCWVTDCCRKRSSFASTEGHLRGGKDCGACLNCLSCRLAFFCPKWKIHMSNIIELPLELLSRKKLSGRGAPGICSSAVS